MLPAWEVKPAMTCPFAALVTFSLANFSVWALLDFLHAFLHWRCAVSFWSLAAIPQMLVNTIRFCGHPIQGRLFRQNSHVQAASRIHSERKQECCINNLSFKVLDTYHVKALLWPVLQGGSFECVHCASLTTESGCEHHKSNENHPSGLISLLLPRAGHADEEEPGTRRDEAGPVFC